MVIGRDSRSEGRGFESWHRILDGRFFTYICCKICNDVCLKRPKINEKEARVGPFFQKRANLGSCYRRRLMSRGHEFEPSHLIPGMGGISRGG